MTLCLWVRLRAPPVSGILSDTGYLHLSLCNLKMLNHGIWTPCFIIDKLFARERTIARWLCAGSCTNWTRALRAVWLKCCGGQRKAMVLFKKQKATNSFCYSYTGIIYKQGLFWLSGQTTSTPESSSFQLPQQAHPLKGVCQLKVKISCFMQVAFQNVICLAKENSPLT